MKKVGIIGGGFSGTMTAVHLIKKTVEPIEIIIINVKETLNKGIAYNPYSRHHLLNVPASKMSAFEDKQQHFLDWVMQQDNYRNKDRNIIASSFLPRYLYGEYLVDIWKETVNSEQAKKINIKVIDGFVVELKFLGTKISLWLSD